MARDGSVTFEWADGEHRFRLALPQLEELQEKTGVGPAALLKRLADGSWRVADLREVIRIGKIGGGAKPEEALRLVKTYVDERPLMESVAPAMLIVAAALHGTDQEPAPGKEGSPPTTATTTGEVSSGSPSSMVSPQV